MPSDLALACSVHVCLLTAHSSRSHDKSVSFFLSLVDLYSWSLSLGPLSQIRSPTLFSCAPLIGWLALLLTNWEWWKKCLHKIKTEDVWPCHCLDCNQMSGHRIQHLNTQCPKHPPTIPVITRSTDAQIPYMKIERLHANYAYLPNTAHHF